MKKFWDYKRTWLQHPMLKLAIALISLFCILQNTHAKTPTSSSIIFDPIHQGIWNVNPDNDSVTATITVPTTRYLEIKVGHRPQNLALDSLGNIWVTNREDSSISIISVASGEVIHTLNLQAGSHPQGIVTDEHYAYVAASAEGVIYRINTQHLSFDSEQDKLPVGPSPFALALSSKTHTLLVTQLTANNQAATITRIDTKGFNEVSSIKINGPHVGQQTNFLKSVTIDGDGKFAWVGAQKYQSNQENKLSDNSTFQGILAKIDLAKNEVSYPVRELEVLPGDIDALHISKDGNHLFLAHGSKNKISVFNTQTKILKQYNASGVNPIGIALNTNTDRIYVQNYLSRRINYFSLEQIDSSGDDTYQLDLKGNYGTLTFSTDRLDNLLLKGKKRFYQANAVGSCNNCHLNDEQDGINWIFKNEEIRNTPSLRETMHRYLTAEGKPNEALKSFLHTHQTETLNEAYTEDELFALYHYLASLKPRIASPYRIDKKQNELEFYKGQVHFNKLNCIQCHTGKNYSDAQLGLKHRLNTGQNQSQTGLQSTSTLRGLWYTAPYFRDGSAKSLLEVLNNQEHSAAHTLSSSEKQQLIAFLLRIDGKQQPHQYASPLAEVTTFAHSTLISKQAVPFNLKMNTTDIEVENVQWFVNGESVTTSTAPQQAFMWAPSQEGVFHVAALITYDQGKTQTLTSKLTMTLNSEPACRTSKTANCPPELSDSDQDGVPDSYDACTKTFPNAIVDVLGCPTDSDLDGIFDGIDQCPDTIKGGVVNAQGCANDADGDGVFDGLDLCDKTQIGAIVDIHGCPSDADADNVSDGIDKCPDTPRGAITDTHGCPSDRDGDGIYDGIDLCPFSQAGSKIDSQGCPIISQDQITSKDKSSTATSKNLLVDGSFDLGQVMFEAQIEHASNTVAWVDAAHFTIQEEDVFNHWAVQLRHYVYLEADQHYTICFHARANKARRIHVDINDALKSDTSLLSQNGQYIDINEDKKQYRITDKISNASDNARLFFNLAEVASEVWVDNIGVYEGNDCGQP